MSVFVDTGVFYAAEDTSATRHETAVDALTTVVEGEYGQPFTSDYVLDEAVTLALQRTGRYESARDLGAKILGEGEFPDPYELLVAGEHRDECWSTFCRYDDHDLSYTDASSVALVETRSIDWLLSFDNDFDGLVDRLDPSAVVTEN